jgi:hypothetical protein
MHMALVYSSYLRVNVAEYGRYEPMITEPMITPKSKWIKGLGCQKPKPVCIYKTEEMTRP